MSSLVELVFQASGTDQAASAVAQVSARMKELQQQLGIAKVFGTENEVAQARQALQLARSADATKGLTTATKEHSASLEGLNGSLGDVVSGFAVFGAAALAARAVFRLRRKGRYGCFVRRRIHEVFSYGNDTIADSARLHLYRS